MQGSFTETSKSAFGCFGVHLRATGGIQLLPEQLVVAPGGWPAWVLDGAGQSEAGHLVTRLAGTSVWVDAAARIVRVKLGRDEPPESLLHPWMVNAFAHVLREHRGAAFHGGCVVLGGRAWGVLGHKGAGKTTLLAALDRAGHPILADDTIAIRDGLALAGPRFLDLRPLAARMFPAARPLGRVGERSRWRVDLGAAPAEVPFAGWVLPEWGGETPTLRPVPVQDRVRLIAESRLLDDPQRDGHRLLELAAAPMLRLVRPRNIARLDQSVRLLEQLARDATEQRFGAGTRFP